MCVFVCIYTHAWTSVRVQHWVSVLSFCHKGSGIELRLVSKHLFLLNRLAGLLPRFPLLPFEAGCYSVATLSLNSWSSCLPNAAVLGSATILVWRDIFSKMCWLQCRIWNHISEFFIDCFIMKSVGHSCTLSGYFTYKLCFNELILVNTEPFC